MQTFVYKKQEFLLLLNNLTEIVSNFIIFTTIN